MSGIITDNVGRASGLKKAPTVATGRTLISTQTVALAAEAALIAVTAGIDSTYNIYEWILTEVETSVDNIKSYMRCYTGSASEETGSIYSYHYNITAADGTGYGEFMRMALRQGWKLLVLTELVRVKSMRYGSRSTIRLGRRTIK